MRPLDRRPVPRFRCLSCLRTFSLQSFAFSYYLKLPQLSVPIAAMLQAGSAHRQIARSLGCSPHTVTRRTARLGRHALLLSSLALDTLPSLSDRAVVVDHFESFAYSQDFPFGLATAVGQNSWYIYTLDPAPHRRSGRTSKQPHPASLRQPRGSYRRSFRRVLDLLLAHAPPARRLRVITDGHPAYLHAVAHHPRQDRVHHRAFPNPPRGPKGSPRAREARRRDEQMFPVDLLHGLTRHSSAHHRRETIAFCWRLNALLERAFLLAVWCNFIKTRSERRRGEPTPAMAIGLAERPWSWHRLLARRLFPTRLKPPISWMKVYRRGWITPPLPRNALHQLRHAY